MGRALPRITKAINEGELQGTAHAKASAVAPNAASTTATGNPDLNVVCNQGRIKLGTSCRLSLTYLDLCSGYAQAVHHVSCCSCSSRSSTARLTALPQVHWHLVPAPVFDFESSTLSTASKLAKTSPNKKKSTEPHSHQYMLRGEMANRDFLDDDEAKVLVESIKSKL